MAPAFLIVGSTGNTGTGVVNALSTLLEKSKVYSDYKIIALTRTASSPVAQKLSQLPHVQVIEKNWLSLDAAWLREHDIRRMFMASHSGPTQFTDESLVLNQAREAGVEYVVRVSTTASYITPDTSIFVGRIHWALEAMLSQPEFDSLKWTSLRPNGFTGMFLQGLQVWLKNYRETGRKDPLGITMDRDHPTALIDPYEVGVIAAHLLASEDITPHASKKYTVVGPQDVAGKDLLKILEKHADTTIDQVNYRDLSYLEFLKQSGYPEYLIPSLATATSFGYEGACSLKGSPTSPEVLALYAPKNGGLDAIDAALAAM